MMLARLRTHWRRLRQPPPLDLAQPPLLAEVVIHVLQDGGHRMYVSKTGLVPEELQRIAMACFAAALDFARQHGIRVDIQPAPDAPPPRPVD